MLHYQYALLIASILLIDTTLLIATILLMVTILLTDTMSSIATTSLIYRIASLLQKIITFQKLSSDWSILYKYNIQSIITI